MRPSKRTERVGILMTCGVHRKRRPNGAGLAAAMPPTISPPMTGSGLWTRPGPVPCVENAILGIFKVASPGHVRTAQEESIAYALIPISQPSLPALASCFQYPPGTNEKTGSLPSISINGGTCHMRTVKLASVQVAEVLQSGSRGEPPRSMSVHTGGRRRASRPLAQEGAVNRCPSVVRKPTRLSLENQAGGHPQRARQAARRPCSTSWRTCEQPVHRPRSQ